jgi:hypothetical protein
VAAQEVAQQLPKCSGFAERALMPRYVTTFIDCRGTRRWRFRRSGVQGYFSREPGTKVFEREYREFMRGFIPKRKPTKLANNYSVYFMCCRNAIKIGYARDVQKRLKAHQVSQPVPVGLMATTPGGVELEREYHRMFAKYRIRGEWFEDAPEILAEIARLRKGEVPLPLVPPMRKAA